jgi:molybdenum cofactor synthesis domain-containing protein
MDIARALREAGESADLVVTTGGTGLAPRDVTPEATRDVLDLEVPGIAEMMRAESLKVTPHAALSRATAGLLGPSLVVNLPGSVKGARENLEAVLPVVPHAVDLARGRVTDCGRTEEESCPRPK